MLYVKMMSFIDEVVAANPSIASSYIAGQTYEKRNLKVIVLKTSTSKKNIWIGFQEKLWNVGMQYPSSKSMGA